MGGSALLVELARYTNGTEALIVRSMLAAYGVEAVIFDAGMNVADSSGWLVPVRLMVLDDDRDEANALLAANTSSGDEKLA